MARRNVYLQYKQDTSFLLYRLIQSSNDIIRSARKLEEGDPTEVVAGKITVAQMVALAKFIAKHTTTIPPIIFYLFRCVIKARTETYEWFEELVVVSPDPTIKKSNKSHKYFIDALTEVFHALGGKEWEDAGRPGAAFGKDASQIKAELDRLLLQNKFDTLGIETTQDADSEDEALRHDSTAPPRKAQQRRPGKRKRGKRMKKSGKQQETATTNGHRLDDLSLDDCGIIQDDDGMFSEYSMAIFALLEDMANLRAYCQRLWRECVYDRLNSAVAAAVSHLAIAMIQRSSVAIFIDFPGRDTYHAVLEAFLQGGVEQTEQDPPDHGHPMPNNRPDMKEQCTTYTYQALIDFVEDFQKTRSGKPTKRMLAAIRDWDPNLNLQEATGPERFRWRRAYTIKWLYDLVNTLSAPVIQANTGPKGKKLPLEDLDWSPPAQFSRPCRFLGLRDFAGFVTSLAMKKHGTDICKLVLAHHVFQLQCIVDSFTVSRGWSFNPVKGDILVQAPKDYHAQRDLDIFLDREVKRPTTGFLEAVAILQRLSDLDADLYADRTKLDHIVDTLAMFERDFDRCLGVSKHMQEDKAMPRSLFIRVDPNGLWEYSPFLCGAGLMEGLEIAYGLGMYLWELLTEPRLLVHLHNMLVQKGYLKEPVAFYETLGVWFGRTFFEDGNPPTSRFKQALSARIGIARVVGARLTRKTSAKGKGEGLASGDLHRILHVEMNPTFHVKSSLVLYRRANWNVDGIPAADVPLDSSLFTVQLAQQAQVGIDEETEALSLEKTPAVERALAADWTEERLVAAIAGTKALTEAFASQPVLVKGQVPPEIQAIIDGWLPSADEQQRESDDSDQVGKKVGSDEGSEGSLQRGPDESSGGCKLGGLGCMKRGPDQSGENGECAKRDEVHDSSEQVMPGSVSDAPEPLNSRDLLEAVKRDLVHDLTREPKPLSGINYVAATCNMLLLFACVEEELKQRRNPLYVSIYEADLRHSINKREVLVLRALGGENEECLQVMADELRRSETSIYQHFFFDREDLNAGDLWVGGYHKTTQMDEETGANVCLVM